MDDRGPGPHQVSLYVEPAEQGPLDRIRRGVGEKLQAGITEIAEVPPPKKSRSCPGSVTRVWPLWAVTNGSRPGLAAVVSLHPGQEF